MAWSLITLALFLFVKRVLAENVMLGESVKFTVTAQCAEELRTRDSSRTVAALVDGVWTPGDFYKDRIKHLSPSAVILTAVNYNDNGLFEFFCGGGRVVTRVHLRVVAPWKISAPRGGAVVVPCHSFTAGGHVESSEWEKDGEVVMELHPSAGSVTIRAGLKDRVSVPSDWNLTGDWSLTLKEVQTEDRGVYICHARDRNGKESLVAVRLTVDEGPLDQISATSPPASVSRPPFTKASCITGLFICDHVD